MTCTVPGWFRFNKWFESRFGDLCDAHDAAYTMRIWRYKVASDFDFCGNMALRGYPALAWVCLLVFVFLGTPYWLWKKYIKRLKQL